MGVSRSAKELNGKLTKATKVVGDSGARKSLLPVARRVEQVMVRSAAQAGLHKGSKIGGKSWRGVYVRNQGAQELAVGYANPAHLVNSKTKAHLIGARKLGTRGAINKRVQGASLIGALTGGGVAASFKPRGTAKGAKALHFGSTFRAYVRSPGTKGKRFYEKALPVARTEGGEEYAKTVTRNLARVFE